MMIVPRAYAQQPRKTRSTDFSEKSNYKSTRSGSRSPRAASPTPSSLFRSPDSSPTGSPKRSESASRVRLQPQFPGRDVPVRPQPTPLPQKEPPKFRKESTKDLLSSTAIPIRKKPRGRPSQKLPSCDHVANFSTLLMDDLKHSLPSHSPRSMSNTQFDGLFGNMDELLEDGQMFVGSEGLDSGVLSTRSLSDDSLISMPSPDDFPASDHTSQHSSTSMSVPERKLRQVVASEDCSDDHPLSPPKALDAASAQASDRTLSPPRMKKLPEHSERRPRQSLKSSLTASLRALKSAAQSVSNRTIADSVDARAHAFFEFHPSLTDDRRPPPSLDDPTAELRRYLSPPPLDSAAQFHVWQDHRHSNLDAPNPAKARKQTNKSKRSPSGRARTPPGSNPLVKDLPSVVQLSNCLPPSVRTENASSPPIWLTQDGTPVNKNTSIPLLYNPDANGGKGEPSGFRHREPRENRDFLRVFVCEMQMRRNGKLSDDLSAGRARLWLPPVAPNNTAPTLPKKAGETVVLRGAGESRKKKAAEERFICMTMADA